MKVIIKKARPNDWQIIQKLNHEVFLDNKQYDAYEDVNWPFSKEGERYYQKAVSASGYITLIAWANQQPIAYITGTEKDFDYRKKLKVVEIENMGVSPSYRSAGVGSLLISEFKKIAKQKKFTHLFVDAYADNKRAIRFYQNQGLKPIGLELEGKL